MPPQRLPGITFDKFFEQGGVEGFARAAALRAIAEERATWLPDVEAWLATLGDDDDLMVRVYLDAEIRRVRKLLHLPPIRSPEAVERHRQQTRERVRRYRQRLKANGARPTALGAAACRARRRARKIRRRAAQTSK
jgi:hypothetical protein